MNFPDLNHPARRSFWALFATIVFVTLVLYWPRTTMDLVLDDHYIIARNPLIKNPSLYPQIFSNSFFAAAHRAPESGLNYYRPFLSLSFALDYQLWGLNAFGYRVVNVFLHMINTTLVFIFLYALFKRRELAAIAALIFCVHPVHEWTVRYIVGRGDLLQAFFTLVSLIAVIEFLKKSQKKWLILSFSAFVMAMLFREVAIINFTYVFLIAFFMTRNIRQTLKISLPFFLLGLLYYGLRWMFFPISSFNVAEVFNELGPAFLYYSHLLVPTLIQGILSPSILMMIAMVLGGLALLQLWKGRRNVENLILVAFCLAWILIGILPLIATQSIITRLGPFLSEHFLDFTCIGFALLLAFFLEQIRNGWLRKILLTVTMSYFVGVSLLNGYYWQNEEILLRHAQDLEKQDFTVAYEQLAMRFEDNEEAVIKLLERAPSPAIRSLWSKRLANIYHQRKDFARTIKFLNEAVVLNPVNVEAWDELAVAYWETGEIQQGFTSIEQSLKVDSQRGDPYRLLGTTFYRQGDFAQAITMLEKALAYDPDDQNARMLLKAARERLETRDLRPET